MSTGTATTAPSTMPPDLESRIVEFARAFRSAARAVGFYPPGHPAIANSLNLLVELSRKAANGSALSLTILPGSLLLRGMAPSRPDAALTELAILLHRHGIGAFTLHGSSDVEAWRTLLQLLARAPDEVRGAGGIRRQWNVTGGTSIEILEIDYAELLRGRIGGDAAELSALIDHYLEGGAAVSIEDAALQALMAIAKDDPDKQEEGSAIAARVGNVRIQTAALLKVLRGLADVVATTQPERFDEVFRKAATVGSQLSVDAMLELLAARGTEEAMVGSVDVVAEFVARMDNGTIASFVANSFMHDGPSQRLAEAFSCLAADLERRTIVLTLAQQQVAESPMQVEEGFLDTWDRVERMLESYSDRAFVSEDYARELKSARNRAVDVEQTDDDPPERIASWLGTIDERELRSLDLRLVLDLLKVEIDPFRWREILETAMPHVHDLVRVGDFDAAAQLVEAVAHEAADRGKVFRRPFALEALDRLIRSSLVRDSLAVLRKCNDATYVLVRRIIHALGPGVVGTIVEIWSSEQDSRVRRRLQQIVIGFGARGRESVQKLMNAADWEVRRAAVYLLREFGGSEDLAALKPLLTDTDPRVRREALQTIALAGDQRTYELIIDLLVSGPSEVQRNLVEELSEMCDERAGPFFCHLVTVTEPRHAHRGLHLKAIELLGKFGSADAVAALTEALHRGSWLAPLKTRLFRQAAASALVRIASPVALQNLRDAATKGPREVRVISSRELSRAGQAA